MHGPAAFGNGPAAIVLDAANPRRRARALDDLSGGFRRWRLARALAWLDIRNRYRGSVLGPFWLSLSTAVMLVGLGVLYSILLRVEVRDYLPFLGISLICWNLIAQTVTDACTAFTAAEGPIRQMPLPYTVHVLRVVLRNAIIAAHNLPLIVIIFLIFGLVPDWGLLLLPLGLLLLGINAFAVSMLLGMVCARFRDVAQIVTSLMQIAFFMTPIIWKPDALKESAWIVLFNPFYVIMETVRAPLIEGGGSILVWVAAILATAVIAAISFAFFVRFRGRVAFWV